MALAVVFVGSTAIAEGKEALLTTGALMTQCAADRSWCIKAIRNSQLDERVMDAPLNRKRDCPPTDGWDDDRRARAVLDWLSQHPQPPDTPASDSILAAEIDLWPCRG